MAEESSQQRTEKATPRKKEESRKKGVVARSVEVNSAFILLAGTFFLYLAGRQMSGNLHRFSAEIFNSIDTFHLTVQSTGTLFFMVMLFIAKTLGPLILIIFIIGFAVSASQVGLVFSTESLTPQLNRISPVSGMQRLFSGKSMMELVKSLIKMIVIGYIGYSVIAKVFDKFVPLVDASVPDMAAFMSSAMFTLLFKCIAALVIIAVLDYGYERWSYNKQVMMTKQELKEEMKQSDGNPQIKSRIRSVQQQLARNRMMAKVPTADVVITNPTHYAVALKYTPGEMSAPEVLAKGANLIALKIIEIARENKVPVVENKPLAQSLYKSVDIGKQIPENLYKAVAEVLAYVFGLKKRKAI